MKQQPLGIGVIGAGHIIKRHATAYSALPKLARLVGVADIDAKRSAEAKEQYGFANSYTDYHEMLANPDIQVVSVCTPAGLHARMVIDAVVAGKHVLCEKPMTTTPAQADEIIQACKKNPASKVSFVFQMRTDPVFSRMRWLIQQGQIGKVLKASVTVRLRKKPAYYTNTPGRGTFKADGGGVLVNQAIHQIDALVSFLGEPVQACAVMDTFVMPCETEDTIIGWVKFASGAFATIDCTVCSHQKNFEIEVLGENASMRVAGDPDGHKFGWLVKGRGSAAVKSIKAAGMKACPAPADPPKWQLRFQKTLNKILRRPWQPPLHWEHIPYVKAFLDSIISGTETLVPPVEAKRSIELATALYQSAQTGTIVSLPLTPDSPCYNGVTASGAGSSKGKSGDVVQKSGSVAISDINKNKAMHEELAG